MRRIILTPVGSTGDVNPFLWMGSVLQCHGHPVSVVANPVYESLVRSRGMEFTPVGEVSDYEAVVRNPALWHPLRGTPFVLRMAGEATGPLLHAIEEAIGRDTEPPLLIGPSLAFGARLAHEKLGFPLVTVQLQPSACLSAHDLSTPAAGWEFLPRLPLALRRAVIALIHLRMNREVAPGVRRACKWASVPPPSNAFRDWWQSGERILCLFPEWFGPPQPDWPAGAVCVGFPLFDQSDQSAITPDLEAFLGAGSAPVLFTAGSAMAHCGSFFRTAADVCTQLGIRAIFATKFSDALPRELPPEIHVADYAPFGLVLPRCAAIVHHGGIGTVSQALVAGIPQLIAPLAHDQPDNAARVRALGVGDFLWSRDFRNPAASAALHRILTDPGIRDRCTAVAEKFSESDPAGRLVEALAPYLHAPFASRTRRIALISRRNSA
jgi:Glycosyl transferases, related to UDP-glucuronosyltransferase